MGGGVEGWWSGTEAGRPTTWMTLAQCPFAPPHDVSCHDNRGPIIDCQGSLDTVDRTAIANPDEPSKRAVMIAAALALATDVVVTTQVRPAPLRRAVRLAIPVVLTRPVAGILTRLGV